MFVQFVSARAGHGVTFWLVLIAACIWTTTVWSAPSTEAGSETTLAEAATESDLDQYPDEDLPEGRIPGGGQWGWLTDNLRWAVDLAGRVTVPVDQGDVGHQEFFGLDTHKVVSTSKRDWATVLVQLYLKNKDDQEVKFTPRLVYVNFMVSPKGMFNVRLGPILVPFGLNLPSLAPGTLRQFSTGKNVGFKVDWGTSLNGVLPVGNYEIALSRGSGSEYDSRNSPYLVSGRLGTPADRRFVVGLSGLYGKVLRPKLTNPLQRYRVGLDLRWLGGPIDALAEVAYGEDKGDTPVLNSFLELSWNSPYESLLIYVQGRIYWQRPEQSWERTAYLTAGAQWNVIRHIWASAQYRQGLSRSSRDDRPDLFSAQLRYRFF